MAVNGIITRNYTRETLNIALEEALVPQTNEKTERIPIITSIRKGKKNERKKKKQKAKGRRSFNLVMAKRTLFRP